MVRRRRNATRRALSLVEDRHGSLRDEFQVAHAQLELKTRHGCRFEKSGSKSSVDFDRCADDLVRQAAEFREIDIHPEARCKDHTLQIPRLFNGKAYTACIFCDVNWMSCLRFL